MMDANDSMQKSKSKLTAWIKKHELIDPHTYLYGNENQPATFIGGTVRIDYFLVSADLIPYVNKAGILPFTGYYESDHRALFIDIDLHRVLKGTPCNPINRDARTIDSKTSWKVKKYQEYVHQKCTETRLFERAKALEDGSYTTKKDIHQELEEIDQELTNILLDAERICKAKQQYPWSPALRQCQNRIRYWKLWVRELTRFKDYGKRRAAIEVSFEVPIAIPTLKEAKKQLRQAVKAISEVHKYAFHHRAEFLCARAEFLQFSGEGHAAAIVKRIAHMEAKQQIYRHLKWISRKYNPPALSFLLEENNGCLTTITGSEEIHSSLLTRNINHFSQADNTPFAKGCFRDMCGKYGTNTLSKKVLDGSPPPELPNHSDASHIFFNSLTSYQDPRDSRC
jgi:hypothetical protein